MKCQGWLFLFVIACSCDLITGCKSPTPLANMPQAAIVTSSNIEPVTPLPLPALDSQSTDGESSRNQLTLAVPMLNEVVTAAYQEPLELPVPEEVIPKTLEETASGRLALDEVLLAVERSYPLLVETMMEQQVADGKQLAAWGEFDTKLAGFSMSEPQGFYKNYRNELGLEQPLYRGGYVFGGYRIGDGDFEPWYKERETNEGGEFALGLGVPLLQNRAIDKRRAGVMQADLARQAVDPAIQAQLLEFVQIATKVYWSWIAAGQALTAQRELLENAETRVAQIVARVDEGDLKKITRINNEQLIAAREAKVIEAERKLQQAAIKLSLFYRDVTGQPVMPIESQLPSSFPEHVTPNTELMELDIETAIASSPVLRELDFVARQVRVDLRNAENMLLPKFDALMKASQDVGAPASSINDKGPFELEAGFYGEVPLQRRESRGKISARRSLGHGGSRWTN